MNKPQYYGIEPNDNGLWEVRKYKKKKKEYRVLGTFSTNDEAVDWFIANIVQPDDVE